jgi:arylsulfatase A-like enzyme
MGDNAAQHRTARHGQVMTETSNNGSESTHPRRAILAAAAGLAAHGLLADAKKNRGKRRKRRRRRGQGVALPARTSTAERPDIVVVLTDDMREDDWPVLRQAQALIGGTWFPNFCYDVAVCAATRATFFTGRHAHAHGITTNDHADARFRPHEPDSLGPAIQAASYHTAYVGKYLNEYRAGRVPPGWSDWRGMEMRDESYRLGGGYATGVVSARATDAIVTAPTEQPLFLVVSHRAPHEPQTPAKKYRSADVGPTRNGKDAARKRTLLSVDDSIVAIAAAMGERWASAVVLMLSDNGYLLGEHGTEGKAIWWDQAARVPLLARLPRAVGGIDARIASSIDLCPTLLRAAGADAWWPVQGRALQDSWDRDGVLIAGYQDQSSGEKRTPFFAIKGPGWVYVEPRGQPPRYYADPGEQTNAIASIDQPAYAAWLAELRAA